MTPTLTPNPAIELLDTQIRGLRTTRTTHQRNLGLWQQAVSDLGYEIARIDAQIDGLDLARHCLEMQ